MIFIITDCGFAVWQFSVASALQSTVAQSHACDTLHVYALSVLEVIVMRGLVS